MNKIINWELSLQIKDDGDYIKLVKFLAKNKYSFTVEPNYFLESSTVSLVEITGCWTNNLLHVSKWIDKHISDSIE